MRSIRKIHLIREDSPRIHLDELGAAAAQRSEPHRRRQRGPREHPHPAVQRAITLTGSPNATTVHADPDDLHQILTNLVSNAVKFTPEGGTVILTTAHTEDDTVLITVTDTGPGMDDDALAHAFDRFYRAPNAERDSIPGTGLGLSIVAELVDRNAGTITLASPASGGLTATIVLPATAAVVTEPV